MSMSMSMSVSCYCVVCGDYHPSSSIDLDASSSSSSSSSFSNDNKTEEALIEPYTQALGLTLNSDDKTDLYSAQTNLPPPTLKKRRNQSDQATLSNTTHPSTSSEIPRDTAPPPSSRSIPNEMSSSISPMESVCRGERRCRGWGCWKGVEWWWIPGFGGR